MWRRVWRRRGTRSLGRALLCARLWRGGRGLGGGVCAGRGAGLRIWGGGPLLLGGWDWEEGSGVRARWVGWVGVWIGGCWTGWKLLMHRVEGD